MKSPTKRTARRLAAVLAIATAFAATGAWAATTTYYQIAGTSDETCLIANDGLAFDEEITTTPKLAFPGIALDDIPEGASFFSKFWGNWSSWKSIDQAVTAVGFCEQRCDSDGNGKTDKIALQVCVYDGQIKGVVIVLTNGQGGDGVYVQRYGRVGVSGSSVYTTAQFTLNADGTMSKTGNVTTGDDTKYRLQGLSIHGMSPVNTASRLAFRGATLEDVKDCQFMAGFQFGTWMTSATENNAAAFVSPWYDSNDGNKLKKVVMQFRASTGATAVIELTDGTGGVYAQQVLGVSDINSANTQAFAINPDTGAVAKATAGTDRGAEKYGIHDFVIKYPPCLKKTPNKIKVWSSGDSENPLTLDDIAAGMFTARFSGATGKDKGFLDAPNSATGYFKKIRTDDIVVEYQVQNGDYDCCVVVSFTNGVDGIYAEVIGAKNKKDKTAGNYEFYNANGTFNDCNNSTVAETWTANYYGVCDLRVTVPMVHKWTLDATKDWSTLSGGETVEADEIVFITVTDPEAVLTVDEDVEVGKIEFVGGICAQLIVDSGKTLTAERITGAAKITNNGTLVKAGAGTEAWPFDNASMGTTTVSAGTLKVASKTGSGTAHAVRVKDGAAFDLNGVWATAVAVVLEGGANFANTGSSDAAWGTSINIRSLTLEGDATVTVTRTFGLRTTDHGANTLNLGAYTLTVNAASGKSFFVDNTTINGTGKILVASGTLFSYSDSHGDAYTLEVGAGGTLAGGGNGITCGDFVNHGSINGSNNKLIVKGTLTPGNSLIFLTLANGATIKASATQAQTVSTTFSVSGTGDKTITVDASDITKDKLGAGNVAVLTVPSSFNTSSVTWNVSGEQIAGTRAKWRTDGTTKTLYLCKPTGLMVIFR